MYPRFRTFWPWPAIVRHDRGLAASPPVRYRLEVEGVEYSPSLHRPLLTDNLPKAQRLASRQSIRTYDRIVGELKAIGYNGQPRQPALRPGAPPVTVLVGLAALLPREPHRAGGLQPGRTADAFGPRRSAHLLGHLRAGQLGGLVTYEIAYGVRRSSVTHWIPAWMLTRKTD